MDFRTVKGPGSSHDGDDIPTGAGRPTPPSLLWPALGGRGSQPRAAPSLARAPVGAVAAVGKSHPDPGRTRVAPTDRSIWASDPVWPVCGRFGTISVPHGDYAARRDFPG